MVPTQLVNTTAPQLVGVNQVVQVPCGLRGRVSFFNMPCRSLTSSADVADLGFSFVLPLPTQRPTPQKRSPPDALDALLTSALRLIRRDTLSREAGQSRLPHSKSACRNCLPQVSLAQLTPTEFFASSCCDSVVAGQWCD